MWKLSRMLGCLAAALVLNGCTQKGEQLSDAERHPAIKRVMGEGPALFMVHGGPGMTHEYLIPGFEFLSPYRTLVFYDQPPSSRVRDYVRQLQELTRPYHGNYGLLVHSWGFLLLMEFLKVTPAPLHPREVIILTPASFTGAALKKDWQGLFSSFSKKDQAKMAAAKKDPALLPVYIEDIFKYYTYGHKTYPFKVSKGDLAVGDPIIKELGDYDMRPYFKLLPARTLWITGVTDPFLSDHSVPWQMVPKSGHFPYLENPPAFQQTILKWIVSLER